jgi:hypothetical protein
MDLIVEPDIYQPSIDNTGNYIDKIPSFANLKNGLRCPCGARKDKCYETYANFSIHIKSKTHQKWLSDLNLNRSNFLVENISLRETVNTQKMIIARLEKEINNRNMTIDYLTSQLTQKHRACENINLLEFD